MTYLTSARQVQVTQYDSAFIYCILILLLCWVIVSYIVKSRVHTELLATTLDTIEGDLKMRNCALLDTDDCVWYLDSHNVRLQPIAVRFRATQ